MPPKKAKPTKEQLKGLVDEYNIKFEGPAPPKLWPSQYSHLFQVIRNIWANRYDDYKRRTDIDQKTIRKQRARVRDLCTNASRLRTDFGINEDTWRASIEALVFRRFDQEIVCVYCRNENWGSEYEAQPFDKEEKERLETKRTRRRRCTCDDGNNSSRNLNEDSDEENQTKIFSTAIGEAVSHDPQDDLEHSGVPMKPDRVIGLSMNDRYRGYIGSFSVKLSHSPVKKRQLMYPFLVLEAKRESDAPGFRYVEAQTAFPTRRFLRIQDELQRASEIELDPLVWFFAFQGEEWRLHAAILDDKKTVQVFQLWHGNLESQDGALQIFQIVDFVWSWARDVYRSQIRKCLRGRDPYQREPSPTSTNPFPRSQSTFSVLSARSFSQPLLDAVLEDDIITQEVVSDDQPDFQDTSSNPILKWANICDTSLQKAAHTSIRHSNIVKFSFRVLEIPEDHESFIDLIRSLRCDDDTSIMMMEVLRVLCKDQYTLPMKRGQLHDLERYWTGVNMQKSYGRSITSRPDQRVRTFLLFRTFCQQDDWQLNRELYCVVWSLRAASLLEMFLGVDFDFIFDQDCPPSVPDSEFIRAFQQLRELSGTQSVAYALDNTSLILLPSGNASDHETRLQWCQPQSHGIPEHEIERSVAWFDIASCSEDDAVQSYHHQGGRLLWATRKEQATSAPPGFMIIPDNVGKGGGMLVVKPSNWPQQCPRFCLFVLLNHDFQDEACLGNLLRSTIQMRDMYRVYEDGSQEPEAFSAADMHLLKIWGDSFSR